MKIFDYLNEKLIYFFPAKSKEAALQTMISDTLSVCQLPDGDKFRKAILDREQIVSTGIGMGVAIPHAKLHSYPHFFIAVGLLEKGIEWGALDGAPVRLVFLIGGPDDKQTEYLKILSSLTMALRDENLRKQMFEATSPKEILMLFEML